MILPSDPETVLMNAAGLTRGQARVALERLAGQHCLLVKLGDDDWDAAGDLVHYQQPVEATRRAVRRPFIRRAPRSGWAGVRWLTDNDVTDRDVPLWIRESDVPAVDER